MPSWVLRRRRLVAVVVVLALCAQCTTQASASETDAADSTSVSSSLSGGTAGTPVMRPLAMSLLAGLATGVGGIISVYLGAHPSPSHMGAVLSFAAGASVCMALFGSPPCSFHAGFARFQVLWRRYLCSTSGYQSS